MSSAIDTLMMVGGSILLTAYGCGPNIPVGIGGIAVSSLKLVYQSFEKQNFQQKLMSGQVRDLTQCNEGLSRRNVAIEKTIQTIRLFAIHMIPIVGPWRTLFLLDR